MSQILQKLINKNASTPLLFANNMLAKLVPTCRVKTIDDELQRIMDNGDKAHLRSFVNTLLYNPSIVYMGGVAYTLNGILPIKSIDVQLNVEVIRRIQEEESKNAGKDLKELLIHVDSLYSALPVSKGATLDDNVITRTDFIRENIVFAIDTGVRGHQTGVHAMKYIPSYRIRYESTASDAAERKRKTGVWEFPECVIGVRIDRTKTSDNRMLFAMQRQPCIIYPKSSYTHPFVFEDNRICTGTLNGTETDRMIQSMAFLNGVFHYLKQVENIIVNGYHERSGPAGGHLVESRYNRLKIFDTLEDEEKALIAAKTEEIKSQTKAAKEHTKRMARMFSSGGKWE